MPMPSRLVALLLALAAGAPGPAVAGVVLKGRSHDEGRPMVFEMEGKRLRTETTGTGDRVMIFDGVAQRMLMVDSEKKTCRILDEATARATGDKISQQMAKLPPEVREKIKAMSAQQRPAVPPSKHRWSVEATGGSVTVAGHACRHYRVLKDGKPEEEGDHRTEVCLIPWGGDLRREDFAAFSEMMVFAGKMTAAMTAGMGGSNPYGDLGGRVFGAWFGDAPGFPGQSVRIDAGGKRTVEWELTAIERRSIPADRFAPPPGFRQLSLDEPDHGRREDK